MKKFASSSGAIQRSTGLLTTSRKSQLPRSNAIVRLIYHTFHAILLLSNHSLSAVYFTTIIHFNVFDSPRSMIHAGPPWQIPRN
mmetsp:Transcript_33222/g.71799  ORF Transcript_33222/g.71799 Transcript_33222/m.71799 type:complete len:84 (-) Transcript_33222:623-874(-)